MLQEEIKDLVRNKSTSKSTKSTLRVLLGEFERINDGKPINNDQCLSVIKKFVKNIDDTLKYSDSLLPEVKEKLTIERDLMLTFLPKSATMEEMNESIKNIMSLNSFSNKMQAMKPVIDDLEARGLLVDKKELKEMIEEYK